MNELIKITKQGENQVVSARELHEFLGIATRFDMWASRNIVDNFEENLEYERLHKIVQLPNSASRELCSDFALTIDTAKEISMLQRSDKGKEARRYFIECETTPPSNIFNYTLNLN